MTSLILRGAAWLLLIAVAVFTLSPIQFRPVTAAPADVERFVAFALLGGVFCLDLLQSWGRAEKAAWLGPD
jgi:hypothetical protein